MNIKYPRTFHLPWSEGFSNDDKILRNISHFMGKQVVVTEKMDGENTSMYPDDYHARSADSLDHLSQHWAKNFHANISWLIPEGWRICGENLFAKHSIYYTELPSYFMGFSIWTDENLCMDWNTTVQLFNEWGIYNVPILYQGVFNEKVIRGLSTGISKCGGEQEGYVVRLVDSFHYDDFDKSVAKFVRADHVKSTKHWKQEEIIKNQLAK